MKKKILALALSAAMLLSMVACGSASSSKKASKKLKVGLVTDVGGVNDGSFNQSAWEGLQKAGKDMDIDVSYLESKTDSDYAPNIESFMDDDCDIEGFPIETKKINA